VEPILHNLYTVDEAIAAFGNETLLEFFCHNDFIVLPRAVICLVTIGDPATGPFLPSPSSVIWKRPDYRVWLPGQVTEVWDRSQSKVKKLKGHHIFLRLPEDECYFYAGPAHLGSYGGQDYSACFSLDHKLSRETWLRYGGYPGWLVEADHVTHRVEKGNLTEFRRIAEQLRWQEFGHLSLTRYEEDSLTLHTNKGRGWLMYLREPADGGLYTHDVEYTGDPNAEEIFRCVCGIDLEFSALKTLPRDRAIKVAEEFFVTGELPRSIPWAE
jgi:Immunity protein Imm1